MKNGQFRSVFLHVTQKMVLQRGPTFGYNKMILDDIPFMQHVIYKAM